MPLQQLSDSNLLQIALRLSMARVNESESTIARVSELALQHLAAATDLND